MIFKNWKGDAISLTLLVIVLIVLVGYGIKMSGRQCNENNDCGENQYCGSDFECHDFKIIKVYKNDLVIPALIISAALVVGAVILRKKRQEKKVSYDYQVQEQENPYYN